MTGTASPFGALSSGLLARKGEARPAMRRPAIEPTCAPSTGGDDLGWNDMGADIAGDPVPHVLVERANLDASIRAPEVVKSVSIPTAARLQRETAHADKAAFTLRVDAVRHLKLRIASAITDRSAQDLVTQGLDALLDAIPEVAALVAQLPRATPSAEPQKTGPSR